MISGPDLADSGADALDDTRPFMAKNDRQRHRIDLIADDKIGVAHAGRDDPHQHFVGAGLFDGQRFDFERAAFAANDRGFDIAAFARRHGGYFNLSAEIKTTAEFIRSCRGPEKYSAARS